MKDEGSNKQIAQEVNAWVRAHNKRLGAPEPSFDAVVDLEPVVKDPNDPEWAMNPALVAPDRVHPNQVGYTAIANAFPLDVFLNTAGGSRISISSVKIPDADRHQILFEHAVTAFEIPAERTEAFTLVEIVAFPGRSLEAKRKLYQSLASRFQASLPLSTRSSWRRSRLSPPFRAGPSR